jgi:hypothetical protein
MVIVEPLRGDDQHPAILQRDMAEVLTMPTATSSHIYATFLQCLYQWRNTTINTFHFPIGIACMGQIGWYLHHNLRTSTPFTHLAAPTTLATYHKPASAFPMQDQEIPLAVV